MRTLKLVILGVILVALVVLALANRDLVTLNLLPGRMSGLMPVAVQLPLFVVVLASVVVGMVIGYLLEWLREHKHRRQATRKSREVHQLSREVDRLRRENGRPEDDVLALIGDAGPARTGKTGNDIVAIGR
jgi:lipopolysaccharide assembly protein A